MPRQTRVSFVSLGCAKNLVDSEKMLGQLAEAGCAITADENRADVTVINTCGFLDAARVEADQVIREAVERKKAGTLKRVVVAGCLVQRDKEAILERVPGIDALVGVNSRDDIVQAVLGRSGANGQRKRRTNKNGAPDLYLADYHPFVQIDTARLRLTPRHYAYLRISEGCDQKCTFCTIPAIRGPMHCKPPQMVLEEARELISDGVKEISLIGQDTTSYGLGADPLGTDLGGLLRMLDAVDGVGWIRLMYVYPSVFTDEMIDAIAESPRVCNYVDIPLQHINDRVLKAMHRRINRRQTEELLQKIRDRIPGVTIRTTMIVGFPGETQAEFDELTQFVSDFGFDALGVFPYSLEDNTPAGRMTGQLSNEVKQERVDALMLAQQDVAFALADRHVGSSFEVLVDSVSPSGEVWARHEGQAPMVDSTTRLDRCDVSSGEFLTVRCTGRDGYDLVARPVRQALRVLRA